LETATGLAENPERITDTTQVTLLVYDQYEPRFTQPLAGEAGFALFSRVLPQK